MGDQVLRYDRMVEDALRSVARQALEIAAESGLPGGHHFYLTFETKAPGVVIPSFLAEKHPDQMTIVIQFQFHDLTVANDEFSVVLQFGGQSCQLRVPFAALTAFVDPSVKFGLQFKVHDLIQTAEVQPAGNTSDAASEAASDSGEPRTADVVTLDSFRKK